MLMLNRKRTFAIGVFVAVACLVLAFAANDKTGQKTSAEPSPEMVEMQMSNVNLHMERSVVLLRTLPHNIVFTILLHFQSHPSRLTVADGCAAESVISANAA